MNLPKFLIPPVYAHHAGHCGTGKAPAELQGCVEFFFGNIVSILITVAGIAFFFMLIAAGFRYLTSGGDPKALAGAANTLTWAVAGLLIVIVSWFILVLIGQITGFQTITVFRFRVPLFPPTSP